eukprot:GHVL01036182.1.p1 GENE.GHVL01036182.1~~GHVL01036182.1.p1  ORF type:complete len:387 (+),score=57.53 GHVL01036182.1:1074-2234(+)
MKPQQALKGISIVTHLALNDTLDLKIFNQWLDCFIEFDVDYLERTIPDLSNILKCHLKESIKLYDSSHPQLSNVMTKALFKLDILKEKQPVSVMKDKFTKWFVASMRETNEMTLKQSVDGYKKLNILFMRPEVLIPCVVNGFSKVNHKEVTTGLNILTNLVKEDVMDVQSYKYWLISFVEMDHLDLIQDMSMLPKIIREYISITVDGLKSSHPELYDILNQAILSLNQPKNNSAKLEKMTKWFLSCMRLIEIGSMTLQKSMDSVFELQLKTMTSKELSASIKRAFASATPREVEQGFLILSNLHNEQEIEESIFMSWINHFIQEDIMDLLQHMPQISHIFIQFVKTILREKPRIISKQQRFLVDDASQKAEFVHRKMKFNTVKNNM